MLAAASERAAALELHREHPGGEAPGDVSDDMFDAARCYRPRRGARALRPNLESDVEALLEGLEHLLKRRLPDAIPAAGQTSR